MIDNNEVVFQLRKIHDPISGVDLISSKRISNLQIKDNNISFTLMANGYSPDIKAKLTSDVYGIIKQRYPQSEVHIHMNEASKSIYKQMGGTLPQIKNILAVASGKGGVGKSTISVNLAIGLANEGWKVGLIDADLYGPSIPTMLDLVNTKPKVVNVHGKHKLIPIERYGIHCMSIGFIIEPEQAVILRGPRLSGVIKQFINDTIWPELDYLIIDLPPGTGDIQLTLVQTVPVTGGIIVTTPQEVAVADALKATNMFLLDSIKIPIIGVVENMSWFSPPDLPENKYFIFGKGGGERVANFSKSHLLINVPIVQDLRESGDNGLPAAADGDHRLNGVFSELAKNVAQRVKYRNMNMKPTQKVEIKT